MGIWIMQTGRYPHTENKNVLIIFLSELSFYLYLTHYMFLEVPGNEIKYPVVTAHYFFHIVYPDGFR